MPIKAQVRWLLAAGWLITAVLHSFAGDIKIVANASVQQDAISPEELRSIFLLQKGTLKDGSAVFPVLQKNGPAHELFLKQYLDRDANELEIYYQGLVFTGKGTMPKQLNSDAEVVAYVARARGAIGYVSNSASVEGIKVLAVVSGRNKERALLRQVPPLYPEELKKRGIGGVVRLEVDISAKGSVDKVSVLGGNPILAEAAVDAVRQWVYSVAPSATTIEVAVPFEARP